VDEGRQDEYAWSDASPSVRVTVVEDKRKGSTRSYGNLCMYGRHWINKRWTRGKIFELERKLNNQKYDWERKKDDIEWYATGKMKLKDVKAKLASIKKRLAIIGKAKSLFKEFSLPSQGNKCFVIVAFNADFDIRDITAVEIKTLSDDFEMMKEARYYSALSRNLGVKLPRLK
jgi:hypothetical protein